MRSPVDEAAFMAMAPYKVMVDDNFHYMDEDERWEFANVTTADEALAACRKLVDWSLLREYEWRRGQTAELLFDRYVSFGDEPFVVASEGAEKIEFSARTHARERAELIAAHGPVGWLRRATLRAQKRWLSGCWLNQRLSAR